MRADPEKTKGSGKSVTIDPMASGHFGYRAESKKYYDAAQSKKPRDESLLNRARRDQSKTKEEEK